MSPFYIDKSQTGHRSLVVVVVIDLVIQHTANVNPAAAAAAKNMYAKASTPAGSDLFAQKCWKLRPRRVELRSRQGQELEKDHWNKQLSSQDT